MRGAVTLLVLLFFCLSGAWAQGESGGVRDRAQQGHSAGRESRVSEVPMETRGTEAMGVTDEHTTTPDIWNEIKELRDMVREKLRNTEDRVAASEDQVMDLKVEKRITTKEVDELKTDNPALEARLTASGGTEDRQYSLGGQTDSQVEELKTDNTALEARLTASESQVEELKTDNPALEARLTASESQVEELKTDNPALEARLTASEIQCISNVVSQQLEEEDVDAMYITEGCRLYDDPDNHMILSGFQLFPVREH
ncbi:unnamed protein product, partial [Coregonus sp. 'balchen']